VSVVPQARLDLAGYSLPSGLYELAAGCANVEILGEVQSVAPLLAAADVVVCPLRIGGGVKVKVLEALGAGKAVVTTRVGAQGLGGIVAAGGLRVCERPEDFVQTTVDLLRSPRRRRALERRAHEAVTALPTWESAAKTLRTVYDSLVTRRGIGDIDDVKSA
jgi:glycosyltransferase involved in cell wall biosynthesis